MWLVHEDRLGMEVLDSSPAWSGHVSNSTRPYSAAARHAGAHHRPPQPLITDHFRTKVHTASGRAGGPAGRAFLTSPAAFYLLGSD